MNLSFAERMMKLIVYQFDRDINIYWTKHIGVYCIATEHAELKKFAQLNQPRTFLEITQSIWVDEGCQLEFQDQREKSGEGEST